MVGGWRSVNGASPEVICGETDVGREMEMEVRSRHDGRFGDLESWRRGFGACCF